jgi:hypothetical protein
VTLAWTGQPMPGELREEQDTVGQGHDGVELAEALALAASRAGFPSELGEGSGVPLAVTHLRVQEEMAVRFLDVRIHVSDGMPLLGQEPCQTLRNQRLAGSALGADHSDSHRWTATPFVSDHHLRATSMRPLR